MFLLEQKRILICRIQYLKMTADGNEFDSQLITIDSDITTVDNGNNLGIMQLNRYLRITPRALHSLSEPWTFLFSAKFEEPQLLLTILL